MIQVYRRRYICADFLFDSHIVLTVALNLQLEVLASVQPSRKEIEMGPRPSQHIHSGVFPPVKLFPSSPDQDGHLCKPEEDLIDLDESENEM